MNVIIIEDEKPAARRLSRMLEDLGVKANQMLHSVEESIEWFQNNEHPDLLFLDIQLSDGLSFEIFEAILVTNAESIPPDKKEPNGTSEFNLIRTESSNNS